MRKQTNNMDSSTTYIYFMVLQVCETYEHNNNNNIQQYENAKTMENITELFVHGNFHD